MTSERVNPPDSAALPLSRLLPVTRSGRTVSALASVVAIICASALSVGGLLHDPAWASGDSANVQSAPQNRPDTSDPVATDTLGGVVDLAARSTAAVAAGDATSGHLVPPRYGIDLSWPQCGTTLPGISLDFAVIGLTDGYAGTVSPCLSEQVAWAHSQHLRVSLYVVPSSPNAATLAKAARLGPCAVTEQRCSDYHAGVLQARHALAAARAAHLRTNGWWLDVEESAHNTLWSENTAANVAVLRGWVATLRKAHGHVGVYSTGGYWSMITDDWQTRLPQWVAVGLAGIGAARSACSLPFTDGPVVMTQWLTGPYDGNVLCPSPEGTEALTVAAFDGRWHLSRTAGVPSLLTIPVPHPDIEALEAEAKAAEKHAAKVKAAKVKAAKVKAAKVKAAKVKAAKIKAAQSATAKAAAVKAAKAKAAKAKAHAAHKPKPTTKPQPKPKPTPTPTAKPKPAPKPTPTPSPSPKPKPSPTPSPSPTPTPTP
ncbi:MAG: hypothetical protein ACR2FG_00030 [Marmoricola sp.]